MEGWIKLYRKLQNKGYYKNSKYVHLWVHLLFKANHESNEFMFNKKLEKLEPGQFITGRKALAFETGINENTIENILNLFETEQQIQQQKTNKFRIITIKEWGKYQISTTNQQQNNNKITTEQQQNNTNKKEKNVNNEKNGKKKANLFPNFILLFNKIFNKKFKGDKKAERQFNARIKDGYTIEDFEKAITNLYNDKFHKEENFKYATPEFISRADKLEMFLNIQGEKSQSHIQPYVTKYGIKGFRA